MDGYTEFHQYGRQASDELPSITQLTHNVIKALAEDRRRERAALAQVTKRPTRSAASAA